MLTLVPGQGENSSPETRHHGDFTDFLHLFPAASQKCVFHHSLAGAALDASFVSDWCFSAPGMVQSQGTVPLLECLRCLLKCQLFQIWRAFSSSASLFLSQRSKMHEDLHPLTVVRPQVTVVALSVIKNRWILRNCEIWLEQASFRDTDSALISPSLYLKNKLLVQDMSGATVFRNVSKETWVSLEDNPETWNFMWLLGQM